MLVAVVFAVLALALWFPETRIGGALRRLLIHAPVRRLDKLNNLKRGHVLLMLGIFIALATAWLLGREDGVRMAGQATAETLANTIGVGFDLATWLDVTAIGLAVAATVRFREAIRMAAMLTRQWARRCRGVLRANLTSFARARARRARPTARPRRDEDPDRPEPGFAWA